jgi:hypothetical protein
MGSPSYAVIRPAKFACQRTAADIDIAAPARLPAEPWRIVDPERQAVMIERMTGEFSLVRALHQNSADKTYIDAMWKEANEWTSKP